MHSVGTFPFYFLRKCSDEGTGVAEGHHRCPLCQISAALIELSR